MTRLTQGERRVPQGDTQQGGSSGHLTPHTSFTASQQASTMSTRHTQSWHTHCQPTGTITWHFRIYLPRNEGKQGSTLTRLFPLSSSPGLDSLLSAPHCLWPGRRQYLSADSSTFHLPRSDTRLSLLPVPDPVLLCLLSRPPRTYIATHLPTATATPPIHGFVTLLLIYHYYYYYD